MITLGLRIKRKDTGEERDIWGVTTWKICDGEKVYYCAGSSFPESIVIKLYTTSLTAEELFHLAEGCGDSES